MSKTETPKIASSPAFYKGARRYSFRPHERSEIIGVRMVTDRYGVTRPCFVHLYPDGMLDYSPIEDVGNYEIEGPIP
jgi:hypothetical protein